MGDSKDSMDVDEYRERNRQFKLDLQEELGSLGLERFKDCSASFRRMAGLAQGSAERSAAVGKYVSELIEVFSAERDVIADLGIAKLLSDLVVLLPEKKLRHDLYAELKGRAKS